VVLPVFPPFLLPFYSGKTPIATGKNRPGRGERPGPLLRLIGVAVKDFATQRRAPPMKIVYGAHIKD
jgi:hypothetical protein